MKLSIILTVYNKEAFLRRAFDAVLSQDEAEEGDYEVLVVNDGSTDHSSSIIDEYVKIDSRVRVLTQENQGLSMARNNGVTEAKGDYVWFVDADDIISPLSVHRICDAMKTRPDIIPICSNTEGIDGVVRNRVSISVRTGKEMLLDPNWGVCGVFNVIRRVFWEENQLRFYPGIYHEDNEFTPKLLYAAQSVMPIPEVLYTVIPEPNSITQVPRVKRAYDNLIVADSLNSFIKYNNEIGTPIGQVIDNRIAVAINNAFYIICQNSKIEQQLFESHFKTQKQLLRPLQSARRAKYKIEATLFRLFPGHALKVYKTMKLFG